MANITKAVADATVLNETFSQSMIRNPQVIIALFWVMSFVLIFSSIVWVIQKILESWAEKKKENMKRYLWILFLLFLILIAFSYFSITYSSINFLKPIANWFNIPYEISS